jgi:hypothetical protein
MGHIILCGHGPAIAVGQLNLQRILDEHWAHVDALMRGLHISTPT